MISVFAATATELTELKPIRRGLFILGRYVVAALAFVTLKNNIIAWHLLTHFQLAIADCRFVSRPVVGVTRPVVGVNS
jgi:hypothetical protein